MAVEVEAPAAAPTMAEKVAPPKAEGAEGPPRGSDGLTAEERRAKRKAQREAERKARQAIPVEAPAVCPERLPRPSRDELNAKVGALQDAVAECQARMAEIKQAIDQKKNGRKAVLEGTQGARNILVGLRAELKAAYEEKDRINAELKGFDAARDQLRAQQKAIREKTKYVSVQQIDEAVISLEHKMAHTTLSLDEEKRVLSQLSNLKKSRGFVQQYSEMKEKTDGSARDATFQRLKACSEKIKVIKEKEGEQRKVIDKIKGKIDTNKDDIPELIKERSEKYETIKQCREATSKLYDEHRKKEDEYWHNERLIRAFQKVEKQKRWEAAQAERKIRDAERKEREEELRGDPFNEEIDRCDQLVTYLNKFLGITKVVEEVKAEIKTPEGATVLSKHIADDTLDKMFTGMGGGKSKKKKGAKKKNTALMHTFDILSSFATIKVDAPLSKDAIADTIKVIGEKKEDFLVKQKEALKKRAEEKAKKAAEAAAAAEAEAQASTSGEKEADAAEEADGAAAEADNGAAEAEEAGATPATEGEEGA